jgi:cytochrome oxidase Cu insertion factor (SCO1/SenC/PrrC family)
MAQAQLDWWIELIKRIKMDTLENAKVKAGDFCLVDTEGKQVHLTDFVGKKPVVLVFNRGFA